MLTSCRASPRVDESADRGERPDGLPRPSRDVATLVLGAARPPGRGFARLAPFTTVRAESRCWTGVGVTAGSRSAPTSARFGGRGLRVHGRRGRWPWRPGRAEAEREDRPHDPAAQARALGDPTRHDDLPPPGRRCRPVGVAELTEQLPVSHNAVRQHLAKLVDAGLVVETPSRAGGPGRPRPVYELHRRGRSSLGWRRGPTSASSRLLVEIIRTGRSSRGGRPGARPTGSGRPVIAVTTVGDLEVAMAPTGLRARGPHEPTQGAEVVAPHLPVRGRRPSPTVRRLRPPPRASPTGLADGPTLRASEELVANDPRRADCRIRLAPVTDGPTTTARPKLTLRRVVGGVTADRGRPCRRGTSTPERRIHDLVDRLLPGGGDGRPASEPGVRRRGRGRLGRPHHRPSSSTSGAGCCSAQPGYDGVRSSDPHQAVHGLEPLRTELFDRWFLLFAESVDRGWRAPCAEQAKAHAARMATMLARTILGVAGRRTTHSGLTAATPTPRLLDSPPDRRGPA